MKIKFLGVVVAALAAMGGLSSCSDDNNGVIRLPDFPVVSNGAFLLYQGQMYDKIDGALDFLSYKTSTLSKNVFQSANGRSLGDTPQCGLVYGSMMYLGMADSNTIEIVDRSTLKSVKQISLQNSTQGQTPRSMVAWGGKVYIAMFDGYLARLDTLSLKIDASVKVGPNPEIITLHNSRIYVPNSDGMSWNTTGYGKTASVVTLVPFREVKRIEVPQNPYQFLSTSDHLFLVSKGNYADEKAALYEIPETGEAKFIANASMACTALGKVYFADPIWGRTDTKFGVYNTTDGKLSDLEIKNVEYPCGMNIDKIADRLIIASHTTENDKPLYTLPGYVCEFDQNGNFIKKYEGSIGPACIFFDME